MNRLNITPQKPIRMTLKKELVAEYKLKPEERIKKIIAKVKQVMKKYADNGATVEDYEKGKAPNVPIWLKDGSYIYSPKSIGVKLTFSGDKRKSESWTRQYYGVIERLLGNRGLARREISFGEAYVDSYKDGESLACFSGGGSDSQDSTYYHVGCALGSWAPEEDKQLAMELNEAYRAKTGSKLSYIGATTKDIENSPKKPYQRINMVNSFYRTSPEAKWKYFTSSVHMMSCSLYNTDELKAAFYGVGCAKGDWNNPDYSGKVGIDM